MSPSAVTPPRSRVSIMSCKSLCLRARSAGCCVLLALLWLCLCCWFMWGGLPNVLCRRARFGLGVSFCGIIACVTATYEVICLGWDGLGWVGEVIGFVFGVCFCRRAVEAVVGPRVVVAVHAAVCCCCCCGCFWAGSDRLEGAVKPRLVKRRGDGGG